MIQSEISKLFKDFKEHDAKGYHTIDSMLERFYYYVTYRSAVFSKLAEMISKRLDKPTEKVAVEETDISYLEKTLKFYFKPIPSSTAQ